jgi:hypothetical protein
MTDEFHAHQCPYCELRFRYANEVKDHVVHDHPDHAAGFAKANPREHAVPGEPGGR